MNKTECIDSKIDEDVYSSRGNPKKNNSNYKIEDIDAINGFNYLYNQK